MLSTAIARRRTNFRLRTDRNLFNPRTGFGPDPDPAVAVRKNEFRDLANEADRAGVGRGSEEAVIDTILDGLGEQSSLADGARAMWKQAKTLRVKRSDPIWTG